MNKQQQPGFETKCIHYGEDREQYLGAAAPPLFQCSTFTYPDGAAFATRYDPAPPRYEYTRAGNPTTAIFERKMAALEGAEAARAFSSGMAAISAAVLSCVQAGDHIVCVETVYWPTGTFLREYLPKLGVNTTFVRGTEIDHFRNALQPNTRLIFLESPSSFIFEIQDLAAVAQLARSRGITTIIDGSNTTPYFQTPLSLGIDMVVHTASKYIGGHSDLVAGIVLGTEERIARLVKVEGALLGGVCDPFASWLMLRGLRTLALRMDRHSANAQVIAEMLERHPKVERVFYSGLPSHPAAAVAARQMRGHSGMLSFVLHDGRRERAYEVVEALRYFCIGVSWGGYESLAVPLEVYDPSLKRKIWLIRLSVGLESVDDLQADLSAALD